ncbi:hypothetical protein ATANTOWER_016918 [Ataeniobius toweri]|uniref:Uncharacterized protein n=1 Tax=Ataeniobius toweri TaxID=208326 RepID=A0ABU7B9T2_9TELE|nr:hypothetical protein [Ataeniobius toweri]
MAAEKLSMNKGGNTTLHAKKVTVAKQEEVVVLQSQGCGFDSSFLLPHVYMPLGKALNLKYDLITFSQSQSWVNVALV